MTLAEEILSKRELSVFIGVENHSTPYTPCLFDEIWEIPKGLPLKDLLIVPIQGLDVPYKLSKDRMSCNGRSLWILFVQSSALTRNAFLFETFPQTDENTYFTQENINFLLNGNCRVVTVCDIGVYKSRALVNMLNTAISSLDRLNISVCLATILGYNSRGFTDIENGDEKKIYKKQYYLQTDIEAAVLSSRFHFLQIDGKFDIGKLVSIISKTKNPAETKLQQLKHDAACFELSLKPLSDCGALTCILESYNRGESFDFQSFNKNLSSMGFKGNLVDCQWNSTYDKLCKDIREACSSDQRTFCVKKLISAIQNNINNTITFVNSI